MHTFGENLPFTGFSSSTCRYSFVEIFEEILHLASSFTLGQLVANSQLGRAAIVPHTTSEVLVLQALNRPVLHRVMMRVYGA